MPAIHVFGLQLLFGFRITPVALPGYEVTVKENEWVIARKDGKSYFVKEDPCHYTLFPRDEKGRCHTDKGIVVPK